MLRIKKIVENKINFIQPTTVWAVHSFLVDRFWSAAGLSWVDGQKIYSQLKFIVLTYDLFNSITQCYDWEAVSKLISVIFNVTYNCNIFA